MLRTRDLTVLNVTVELGLLPDVQCVQLFFVPDLVQIISQTLGRNHYEILA
jgi:hypothetical protein